MSEYSFEPIRPLKHPEHILDTQYRMRSLNALRSSLGSDDVVRPETNPSDSDQPTIGIEIEMTWDQALGDLRERWLYSPDRPGSYAKNSDTYKEFDAAYRQNDQRLRPVLEHIAQVIPRVGFDAYWEFSFLPTKDTSVLNGELETLFEAQILQESIPYATHLTIAGIPSYRDAFTIACLIEQSGGSTPERIETAISSKKGSWSQKGIGGVRRRYAHELIGDDTVAYEFRTLLCTSPSQLASLLRLGQDLAQTSIHDEEAWKDIRANTEDTLRQQGLRVEPWNRPKADPETWKKYGARLLQSSAQG